MTIAPAPVRPRAAEMRAVSRALSRAEAYATLAAFMRDPEDPGALDRIEPGALFSAAQALGVAVDPAKIRAVRRIRAAAPRTAEHRAIFGHVVADGCPPYETEYGRRHVFGQSQELGDIRGFYEAFGARPRPGGERPDHASCELEFLALLAVKEATAVATGETERAEISREAAGRFVHDHPGRWLPALAGRIADRAPESGYAAVAALAASIVAGHAAELGAETIALDPGDLVPVTDDPDGFAFECGPDGPGADLVPPGAEP